MEYRMGHIRVLEHIRYAAMRYRLLEFTIGGCLHENVTQQERENHEKELCYGWDAYSWHLQPGVVQAAIDDVIVWDTAKTETELDSLLNYHPAGPAAMDDVRIWLTAFDGNDVLDSTSDRSGRKARLPWQPWMISPSGPVRRRRNRSKPDWPTAFPMQAQINDVIVWDGVRSLLQINDTLVNGYSSSTTGMVLWWDFEDPCLGGDATGNGIYGDAAAGLIAAATDTPSGVRGRPWKGSPPKRSSSRACRWEPTRQYVVAHLRVLDARSGTRGRCGVLLADRAQRRPQ